MLLKRSASKLGALPEITHTLIKGCRISAAHPRVGKDDLLGAIGNGCWEFTALEEGNVETQVEHVLKAVVDVNATFGNHIVD
jgi:hypothetical protein